MISGINKSLSPFYISPLSFGLSLVAVIVALISYFGRSEIFRTNTLSAAYIFLLAAISTLLIDTGGANSPFLGLWLLAVILAGAFGKIPLGVLFILVNGYYVGLFIAGELVPTSLIGILLAGELPILVSYIIWHGKTAAPKDPTKDLTYNELANELHQVSSKSEVVISAISDGVIAIDNKGIIELINPAAQRIVGWGHQDAIGLDYKSVLQLLTNNDKELDKSNDPVFSVLSTNQPVRRDDLSLQTSSGKKLNADIVVSPIGRLGSGAIIVFRDVTKEQEEERAQAEFISTASHEMRTPVASIEGYLGLALNPATATIDEKAREFITKAHGSAQHLGRLFQDLLDVTKADDGRLSNNPKVINVVDFTGDIIEGLQQKADQKQLRLFFKAADSTNMDAGGLRNLEPVFFVDLDADHLREVLANLVENAIKYTPRGEVIIDVKGDDSHVVISITDSGIGIPAEDIPHLFQKFYRVDNSDTREIGGTGLGLYLCRRLVETMGGRIWVESEYKKGSTFFVELPRISHEEATRILEASVAEPTAIVNQYPTIVLDSQKTARAEEPVTAPVPVSTPAAQPVATSTQAQPAVAPAQPAVQATQPVATTSISTPVVPAQPPAAEQPQSVDPLLATQPATAQAVPTATHQKTIVLPPRPIAAPVPAAQSQPQTVQPVQQTQSPQA